MIPKIIHYVWIGDRPKSELAQKCIASWREFCPDFEIKEWNNETLKEIEQNLYVSQAIKCKKWAFVSDYVRLYALYSCGGFYLDTDCEITAPIDIFLKYSHILGLEAYDSDIPQKIASSFWGCEKNNVDVKNIMDLYDKLRFIKDDGKMDLTANVHRISTYFQQKYCIEPPYKKDTEYHFGDNGVILPTYFFCKPVRRKANFAIHHFAYSWQDCFTKDILLTFGAFSLMKFTQKIFPADEGFRLLSNEKLLCKIHIGKRYFGIVKKINNSDITKN